VVSAKDPYCRILGFLDRSRYVFFQVAPQLPTERPPLVGEVSANVLRTEDATWSARRIPTAVFSAF
jgi:hypothetical protein